MEGWRDGEGEGEERARARDEGVRDGETRRATEE